MRVTGFVTDGFRNLKKDLFEPGEGINILHGSNAQGKTNLLEGMWLFTGSRGFRNIKDREMVTFGQQKAQLKLDFHSDGREQQAEIEIQNRRSVKVNGVGPGPASKLAGIFCAVLFVPEHLSLIKSGPEQRRKFLDSAYCQLKPGYIRILSEYNRILAQRNNLLKQMGRQLSQDGYWRDQLEVWDQRLAESGARVMLARMAYIQKLKPLAAEIYDGLSGNRETLTLAYEPGEIEVPGNVSNDAIRQLREQLYIKLREGQREDIAAGYSQTGPHREDMAVLINGENARAFGSQGQQRSAVLALKLAEASILYNVTGEKPAAFLDDVMSELDEGRRDYILNQFEGWQVFITCCEPMATLKISGGASFTVSGGEIKKD